MVSEKILKHFGVTERVFLEALKLSPNAQGYISGAISEVLLKEHLEKKGFEVVRIKEKPSGGYRAKSVYGDFYIKKKGDTKNKWLVIESKGLKSNSEFRGGKLDSPQKVFRFLKDRIFNPSKTKGMIYEKGHERYLRKREEWKRKHPKDKFPAFNWNKEFPGPESYQLDGIWRGIDDLKEWVHSLDKSCFTEKSYRAVKGAIAILETHQPSRRVGVKTKIQQAAPLVDDFNIMSVDLFMRTGKHDFVFMNSREISHSPTSPEHLYQNYTIDILVEGKKSNPVIQPPWYSDIETCIRETKPVYGKMDLTQIDDR